MLGGRVSSFADHHDYAARIGGAGMSLVLTGGAKFNARLTEVELPNIRLLRGNETLPRIAYRALAADTTLVDFPLHSTSDLIWGGVRLRPDDIVFHGRGERLHVRTTGPSRWGTATIATDCFAGYLKVLTGRAVALPRSGRIVRAPPLEVSRLRYLHSGACRLAAANPGLLARPEACRALEEDLLHALVTCFVTGHARERTAAEVAHAGIVIRFDNLILAALDKKLPQAEVCDAVGVPERTLRASCLAVLGTSPTRYALLRRLNLVHAALRRDDSATGTVAEHARRHAFTELGRFAAAYRTAFGEAPSITLRRARLQARAHSSAAAAG